MATHTAVPSRLACVAAAASLLALLSACGGSGGSASAPTAPTQPTAPVTTLSLSSSNPQAVTGGAPVALSATVSDSSAVSWSLAPGNPGTLSASSGLTVNYLPPASGVTATTTITVTANANGVSKSVTLALRTADYPRLEFVAGDDGGMSTVDGAGSQARLANITGGTVDPAGNIYVAQSLPASTSLAVLRKITPAGVVSTLASGVPFGGSYVDGARDVARLSSPTCPAAGPDGSVYFVDRPLTSIGPGVDRSIRKLAADGSISTIARISIQGDDSVCLAADAGRLYAYQNERISTVSFSGAVATLAGTVTGGAMPRPVADDAGAAARFRNIFHVVADGHGNLYVNDDQQVVRKVAADGSVSTLAGAYAYAQTVAPADGSGAAARFSKLYQLAMAPDGTVKAYDFYVSDYSAKLRSISPAGVVSSAAVPSLKEVGGEAVDKRLLLSTPGGTLYEALPGQINILGANNSSVRLAGKMHDFGVEIDGAGDVARFNIILRGMGADAAGNVYVADQSMPFNGWEVITGLTLRKVTPDGAVSTIQHNASVLQYTSMLVDGAGNIYVATLDFTMFDDVHGGSRLLKIAPDGSSTVLAGSNAAAVTAQQDGSGAAARFFYLTLIGTDADGNMYGNDRLPGSNATTIRKISPAGVVSTVAALPAGVGAVQDAAGNSYGVSSDGRSVIVRTTPAGVISDVAGTASDVPNRYNYPGDLPAHLERPEQLVRVGPYAFAVYSAGAILRLYVPH